MGPWRLLRKPGRTVYDDGRVRITRTGRRPVLTIAGVINEHTRSGLVTALSRLTAGQPEVHISLRGVIQVRTRRPAGHHLADRLQQRG